MLESAENVVLYSIKYICSIIVVALFFIYDFSINNKKGSSDANLRFFMLLTLFFFIITVCVSFEVYLLDSSYFANKESTVLSPIAMNLESYNIDLSTYDPNSVLSLPPLPTLVTSGAKLVDLTNVYNPIVNKINSYKTNNDLFNSIQSKITNISFDSSILFNIRDELGNAIKNKIGPDGFLSSNNPLIDNIYKYLCFNSYNIPVVPKNSLSIENTLIGGIYTPYCTIYSPVIYFNNQKQINVSEENSQLIRSFFSPLLGSNTDMPDPLGGSLLYNNWYYVNYSDGIYLYNTNGIKIRLYNSKLTIRDINTQILMQEGSIINVSNLLGSSVNTSATILDFISNSTTNQINYSLSTQTNNYTMNTSTISNSINDTIIKQKYSVSLGSTRIYLVGVSTNILPIFQSNIIIRMNVDILNFYANSSLYNQIVAIDNADGSYMVIVQYKGAYQIFVFKKINTVWTVVNKLSSQFV
jgi:hypothetical protein